MSAGAARAFLPQLRRLDADLRVPVRRRLRVLRELDADLEAFAAHLERSGVPAPEAQRRAREALVPEGTALDELGRVHASPYLRLARSLGQGRVRVAERSALILATGALLAWETDTLLDAGAGRGPHHRPRVVRDGPMVRPPRRSPGRASRLRSPPIPSFHGGLVSWLSSGRTWGSSGGPSPGGCSRAGTAAWRDGPWALTPVAPPRHRDYNEVMAPTADDPQPATILVVDDETLVRGLTCRILERMGHEVLSAGDGAEGLEVFRAHHETIDMLVLDQTMPNMAGHEVVATLRREGHETPILVVTGYSAEEILAEIGRATGVKILLKPFRRQELLDAVAELLRGVGGKD